MALTWIDLQLIKVNNRIIELEKSLIDWEVRHSPEKHYMKRYIGKASEIKGTLEINYEMLDALKGLADDKKPKIYYN